jgi:hypothetical protein
MRDFHGEGEEDFGDIKLMILGFMQGLDEEELGGVLHHHPCL